MDLKIKDKTAFLSGSTSGIGFATARAFAKEGVSVIINGRTQIRLTEAVQKLRLEFPDSKITGLCADFGNTKEIKAPLKKLPEIDILVNNVGIYSSTSFFETNDDVWQ